MGSTAFFSNFLSTLFAFANVIIFTAFTIFSFLLISFFLVICEVILSWILVHGWAQRDIEAGQTIYLRQSDDEAFIQDYGVQDNVTLMQTIWRQVLERLRPEYLVEEEDQTQAVLNTLPPPVQYISQAGCDDDECVICLEDFVDGEPCRVFPVCKHNFHLDCIDRWLKNGQVNCPICRQCVVDACAKT